METKKCSKCNKIKPLNEFYWRKDNKKYRNECKECQILKTKIYKLNNPEKIREYHKKNIEKIIEYKKNYSKKWRKKNIERKKKSAKLWYKNNAEITKARSRERYKNNIEEERKYRKEYYKKNAKKIYKKQKEQRAINPYYNLWFRNRRKKDPMFRLNCNIKTAISMSLKGNKNGRHWEELVGYTLKDLMIHLKNLFKESMSWDNYGEWHIDHIKPVSSFNFTSYKDKEFKECWSLENLQPLWAKENIKKGNKLIA